MTVTWPKIEILKVQDGGGRHLENRFYGHNSSTDCQISAKFCIVMNLNFITILCSITVLLWFTYYQSASCQLVITRNYFRRSAIGSAYLGPIALSWAFPYWRHRHFDCNPVCWKPSAIRSDLIYLSCKLFNIPRIDLYVSVYCSKICT